MPVSAAREGFTPAQAADLLKRFNNEAALQGGEAYYDFVLARGVHFAMDLQYVNPAQGQNKNALIGGVRLRIRF